MLETVYLLTHTLRNEDEVLPIIRDAMDNYEAGIYRAEIQDLGIAAVTESEWEHGWLPKNNVGTYATRAKAAQAHEEMHDGDRNYKIVEVDIEDVERTLLDLFGPDTDA